MITIALPKGRIQDELVPLLKTIGIEPEPAFFDGKERLLQFATNNPNIRLIRVRSFDVATFVAFGAAELGVVGSDVLSEFDYPDIYAPLDLGIGKCRLSLAEPVDAPKEELARLSHIRIATKYPNITSRYFASLGIQAECIKLSGAMELAPKLGLARRIVDLVSSGKTLEANGLKEVTTLMDVSSRLVVNRAAFKTRGPELEPIITAFRQLVKG